MFGATDLCQEHVHIFPSMNFSLKTDSFMIWCKFKWEIRNLLFLHTTENNIYMNRQAEHQVAYVPLHFAKTAIEVKYHIWNWRDSRFYYSQCVWKSKVSSSKLLSLGVGVWWWSSACWRVYIDYVVCTDYSNYKFLKEFCVIIPLVCSCIV